jgi:hypothetical protein
VLKRIQLSTLVLLCVLALVTPAGAVTVNGVDYVILGKSYVHMENSADCDPLPADLSKCTIIDGNVGVSDATGVLQIGSNNIIKQTAIANRILFGSFSQIGHCVYNTSVPNPFAGCGTTVTPVPAGGLPIVNPWPLGQGPLPAAVPVDKCVFASPPITVPAGGTASPAPGCYGAVFVGTGGTLNLSSGNYVFKSLLLKAGSTLNGSSAIVNVQGETGSEAGTHISDVTIESPGCPDLTSCTPAQPKAFSVKEFIKIFNGADLKNVNLYAPSDGIHLHSGLHAKNLEAVANFIDVETITTGGSSNEPCACFGGPVAAFLDPATNHLNLIEGHNLNDNQNKFFLSPTCDPAGAGSVDITGKLIPPATDDKASFNLTGVTTTGKHVIVVSQSGSFCSKGLLP